MHPYACIWLDERSVPASRYFLRTRAPFLTVTCRERKVNRMIEYAHIQYIWRTIRYRTRYPTKMMRLRLGNQSGHACDDTTIPADIIDIYARWSKYDGAYPMTPEEFIRKTHVYSVTIPPSAPLAIGKRVRVLAMSPARYRSPDAEVDVYESYDAHVVGRIRKVLGWKGNLVALEVDNECRIPYLPGVTVAPLENLREGKGPKDAQMEDLDLDVRAQPPPQLWACKAGECVLRATSMPGGVIYDEFWLSGSIYADEEKKRTRKAKQQEPVRKGKMAAVGWAIEKN
ncbi:hypothetical protein C8T65DRAFT_652160 [Cerioporus squamosus]|nr:hypothetical protein C8T65DRAFT_652160 [Cerioporus squamosus]